MTHTFVIMDISKSAYDEIAAALRADGHDHAFCADGTIRVGLRYVASGHLDVCPDCGRENSCADGCPSRLP